MRVEEKTNEHRISMMGVESDTLDDRKRAEILTLRWILRRILKGWEAVT
jgi:hypothetical protein